MIPMPRNPHESLLNVSCSSVRHGALAPGNMYWPSTRRRLDRSRVGILARGSRYEHRFTRSVQGVWNRFEAFCKLSMLPGMEAR